MEIQQVRKQQEKNVIVNGLKHSAVAIFIINSKQQVLLQKRSLKQKMWPGMWDLSAGGHVDSGETCIQAAHRELKEELGIDVNPDVLLPIGVDESENIQGNLINRHRNHYYVYSIKDIDLKSLNLQKTEVSAVKWVDREEILSRINNNYEGITDKTTAWKSLKKYYITLDKKNN